MEKRHATTSRGRNGRVAQGAATVVEPTQQSCSLSTGFVDRRDPAAPGSLCQKASRCVARTEDLSVVCGRLFSEQTTKQADLQALVVWSPDYDGKGKAWVRFDAGTDAIVGGSRVER
jgi:hypothetical protein